MRGAGLGLLLVAELIAVTIRFDAENLARSTHWWVREVTEASALLRGLLAFTAVLLLVLSPRLKGTARALADESVDHRWAPWLGLHLVAVGVFWLCTASLFEGGRESVALVVAWGAAAAAAAALWLFAVAPARSWWAMARREPMALLVAASAGVAAGFGRA